MTKAHPEATVASLTAQVAALQAALVPFARLGRAMFDSGNCGPDSPSDWPDQRYLVVEDREHRTPQAFGGMLTVADFRRAEACEGVDDLVTSAILGRTTDGAERSSWLEQQLNATHKEVASWPPARQAAMRAATAD